MNPLPTDASERKAIPVFSGFVKYFPRAMAAVATVSKLGNDQHNPGEELHWSRDKSSDHHDCAMRHLMQAGTVDDDGQLHSAKMAWRAMAILELELEAEDVIEEFDIEEAIQVTKKWCRDIKAMKDDAVVSFKDMRDEILGERPSYVEDMGDTPTFHGVPVKMVPDLSKEVPYKDSFNPPDLNVKVLNVETGAPKCYLGGPMTGHDKLNFPAFDDHKAYLESIGYDVISPADLDRAAGINENDYRLGNMPPPLNDEAMRAILHRDIQAILSLRPGKDAIALMSGWEKSKGACAEFFFAQWYGLNVIDAVHGIAIDAGDVHFENICTGMMEYLRERAS